MSKPNFKITPLKTLKEKFRDKFGKDLITWKEFDKNIIGSNVTQTKRLLNQLQCIAKEKSFKTGKSIERMNKTFSNN